jgi:hypothetical protein
MNSKHGRLLRGLVAILFLTFGTVLIAQNNPAGMLLTLLGGILVGSLT